MRLPRHARHRRGTTLVEIVVVCSIVALVAGITVPVAARLLDRIRLRGAVSEIVALFATARSVAIMRSTHATVKVDEATGTVLLYTARDTLHRNALGAAYAVTLAASRDSVSYGPTGLGWGAANTSIVVRRGSVADTITTSRLGRVRH